MTRDQYIRLGIVHQRVARANPVEGAHQDVVHDSGCRADRHALFGAESQSLDVVGMQQKDITPVLTALKIFFFVHHRIELSFAAHRHQTQLVFRAQQWRQRMRMQ